MWWKEICRKRKPCFSDVTHVVTKRDPGQLLWLRRREASLEHTAILECARFSGLIFCKQSNPQTSKNLNPDHRQCHLQRIRGDFLYRVKAKTPCSEVLSTSSKFDIDKIIKHLLGYENECNLDYKWIVRFVVFARGNPNIEWWVNVESGHAVAAIHASGALTDLCEAITLRDGQ